MTNNHEQTLAISKIKDMMDGLNMPIQVSSKDGAIREMQTRIKEVREGSVQSLGSCRGAPYDTWGN